MRKRLILGGLTLAVIVAGIIALAAFTAQMVNLTARVEKDIAVEPVICDDPGNMDSPCFVDPSGGDYGVVVPQEFYDKIIEVTLSNSFFEQDKYDDLAFDILWECKNTEPTVANPNPPLCRVDIVDDTICAIDTSGDGIPDTVDHCDDANIAGDGAQKLDGLLRDHMLLNEFLDEGRCLADLSDPDTGAPPPAPPHALRPAEKKVDYVATGMLDKADHKCRYELKLFAPPCIGGFNPFTDPHPLADLMEPIWCHKADKDRDGVPEMVNPQDIDEFADLGDDFKIQVISHSSTNPCEDAEDICVDADGIATRFSGVPGALETDIGDPITTWAPGGTPLHIEGIDMFDNDGDGTWTSGDDLHLEEPAGSCPTADRDAVHDLGLDCKVLDFDNGLADQQPVDCDLEGFLAFTGSCPALLAFHDLNGNLSYDNGEDIFKDVNNNGVFD